MKKGKTKYIRKKLLDDKILPNKMKQNKDVIKGL